MVDEDRPWTELYPAAFSAEVPISYASLLEAWQARVLRNPDRSAVAYFDGSMTARELDNASDALAAALHTRGTGRGDGVGIYLQNIPQYAIVLLALWKLGAAAVVLSPMYRRHELRRLVDDAGVGIICADTALMETLESLAGRPVRWLISTSDRGLQTRDDPRVFPAVARPPASAARDLVALLRGVRAAIVGRPDDYRGEEVVAFVSIKPGATASERELIEFVRQRFAPYKCPRAVVIVGELPKTQTGKICRRALRDAPTPTEVRHP